MNDEAEEWRPVLGWEGLYEVSNHARIRSLRRKGVRGQVLKPQTNRGGYQTVNLYDRPYHFKCRTVHSVVAEAFIGPRPTGHHVRHLDGDQTNNLPGNLAYGTPRENNLDVVRHGRHQHAGKPACVRGHLYAEWGVYYPDRRQRCCRACQRIRGARWRAKQKALG